MVGPAARKRDATELARLKREADAARHRIDGTVARLRAEVRDPYGIRTAIAAHPFLTAGVATGAGIAVARLFSGRTTTRPDAPTRLEFWAGKLLDGGLEVMKPLGIAYLKQWLAEFEPPSPDKQSPQSAAA